MTIMVYRIRNFSLCFETAESRKLNRLTWLALPTKQEGDGYTELMGAHENGCAHFGAWTAMLQLAAKCYPRGVFVRDLGGRRVAHDLGSISRITRVPVEVLREAVPRLLEMGWMEEVSLDVVTANLPTSPGTPGENPGQPGESRKKPGSTGEERRGEDSTRQHSTAEGSDMPTPPPASPVLDDPSPASPEIKKQKRRMDLLVILKANAARMDMGGENIFEEWIDVTDGYRLDWIEHLLATVRPRIKLPSKLRGELKAQTAEYTTWKAKA